MLIKFDADQSLADLLKAQYGQKVASKAFALAASDALELASEVRRLRHLVDTLTERNKAQAQLIEGARSVAALLLERVGQTDLF